MNLASANTVKHNLNGKFVIPGLTDAHLHFEWLSRSLNAVDLYEVPSKDEALQRVADFAAKHPDDEWILGRGWSQDLWDDGSFRRLLTLMLSQVIDPRIFLLRVVMPVG